MKFFFSCDWGTTTFRLRLVDAENLAVLSEIKTGEGVAKTFESWKQTKMGEESRLAFFQNCLFEQVKKLTASFDGILTGTPIILSGMASSSIGMMELPYKELPFGSDGTGLPIYPLPALNKQAYPTIIISGARSDVDVIRGEETMLAGCSLVNNNNETIYIFPGTHSKHITVKNGIVHNIATYMTGEFFDLLSNKSILSNSVKKNELGPGTSNRFFMDGVIKGTTSNLLNSIFHIRTNQLFKKATPEENYQYLSGLLIGHELKELVENKPAAIILVCGEQLKNAYLPALGALMPATYTRYENADDALIKGQWKIMRQHGFI